MAVPEVVAKRVLPLAADLQAAVGTSLLSLVLYGSAAGKDYVEGVSDVNLLVVVQDNPVAVLDRLRPHWRQWHKRGLTAPVVVNREFLSRAVDVFPMELADIQAQHELLAGEDLLSGLTIDPEHIRRQAEFELRSKWLRLSALYLHAKAEAALVQSALLEAVKSFCVIMRHLLRLAGAKHPHSYAEVVAEFTDAFGHSLPATVQLLEIRRRQQPWPADCDSLFRAYLEEIGRVVNVADQLFAVPTLRRG